MTYLLLLATSEHGRFPKRPVLGLQRTGRAGTLSRHSRKYLYRTGVGLKDKGMLWS